ncbi:V-type ATP synthase subunit E [Maribellus sp. YY47]|uniref:V-type ATP synthase subunit E n=1 Tax=Maribellus sp. YY47 TaxID=2929486 RepID=UPI0020012534|nr:V-type ATP synthase subunit E [Maribellus sp. YY47]MCK3684488.1 V-type ATP synthase subunit E [Maribellus sp. YY47]
MADRIEEITQKIYNEGVVKAREDARIIISEATSKAAEMVNEAKRQEAEIIGKAQQNAEEIKKKTEVELQLAARQFISALKQKINGLITTQQTENQIKEAFKDQAFIKEIILTTVQNWKQDDGADLLVLLPEKKRKELAAFFDAKAMEVMNKSVEVRVDPQIESGFRISPKNGSYFISFTDTDFINYFKRYLRERTQRLLFDSFEKGGDKIPDKSSDKDIKLH